MELTEEMFNQIVFSIVYLETRQKVLENLLVKGNQQILKELEEAVALTISRPQFAQNVRELQANWRDGTPLPPRSSEKS